MDFEIKDLGCGVYLVRGKVVKVSDPNMGVVTEEGRAGLLDYADALFRDRFSPRPWGSLTVGVIMPKVDGLACRMHMSSRCHFSHLPESVREQFRKEFPDHANAF